MTINDLKDTAEDSRSKVLGSLLTYLAYAYGPQYVRNLWKRSKCKFSDFVPNDEVEKFVEKYVSVTNNSSQSIYFHSILFPSKHALLNLFFVFVVLSSYSSQTEIKICRK